MSSTPRDIQRRSSAAGDAAGSPASLSRSRNRHASTARLSSPVPSHMRSVSISQQESNHRAADIEGLRALPAPLEAGSLQGPGRSALTSALASSPQSQPVNVTETARGRADSGNFNAPSGSERLPRSNYGSLDVRHIAGSPAPIEDPEIVKRHLVQPEQPRARFGSPLRLAPKESGLDDDEFSSLRLQGGDITREVYKWAEDADGSVRGRAKRSQSFHGKAHEPESETLDVQNIRQPGGFRRNYLRRVAGSPAPSSHGQQNDGGNEAAEAQGRPPQLFTSSFLEFLTLYGHFAGEDLEEDDEVLEPDEYFSSDAEYNYADGDDNREPGEDSALLAPGTPGGKRKRKHKERAPTGNNSAFNAALLLLKSFVGTGVLFLPRAFLNGGMLFSCIVLLGVAALSYYCFILLVSTRNRVEASFGDIGGILYGKWMRAAILFSIVLSQIGFVSAYIVFTSENLQAFVSAVSKCKSFIDIKYMVMMQLIIFLPLSLIRDIGKLGFTALIADAFILLGLLYLYYYDIFTMVELGGVADIKMFNASSWTLFIGTAIFTFEGVGLIIPIQESMKRPQDFPRVLALVMIIITLLFTSIGVMSYAAYGSHTKTVVILNLPQDSKFVNAVQFLYSLAILLSTPLQLFPVIRILENELFTRSGKYNPFIKWEKNVFRFFLVVLCALIAWGGAGDLDKFVSLVGSFACVPLVYIYPPLLHLKAVSKTRRQRIADYVLCVFGVLGCAYTTALTIQQWAAGSSGKAPGYCDKQGT